MPPRWQALRHLRLYQSAGALYIGAILYLSLMFHPPAGPDIPLADKWEHFLAYGVLMAWWGQLVQGPRQRRNFALAFVAMGGLVEILQGLGGVRFAEWGDFFANSIGVALGFGLTLGAGGRAVAWVESKL